MATRRARSQRLHLRCGRQSGAVGVCGRRHRARHHDVGGVHVDRVLRRGRVREFRMGRPRPCADRRARPQPLRRSLGARLVAPRARHLRLLRAHDLRRGVLRLPVHRLVGAPGDRGRAPLDVHERDCRRHGHDGAQGTSRPGRGVSAGERSRRRHDGSRRVPANPREGLLPNAQGRGLHGQRRHAAARPRSNPSTS